MLRIVSKKVKSVKHTSTEGDVLLGGQSKVNPLLPLCVVFSFLRENNSQNIWKNYCIRYGTVIRCRIRKNVVFKYDRRDSMVFIY